MITCISEDVEVQAVVRRAQATWPEDVQAGLTGVIVDAGLPEAALTQALEQYANVAVLGVRGDIHAWTLMRHRHVHHLLLPEPQLAPRVLPWIGLFGNADEITGGLLPLCLGTGASLTQFAVARANKHQCLVTVTDDAQAIGLRRRPLAGLQGALDELLMNALIDAPAMAGAPDDPRAVTVQWGYDAQYVGVSVRDAYGLLSKARFVESVTAAMARGGAPLMHAGGGAGLGLYLVANTASHLLVHAKPGQFTEVVCLFQRDARARGTSVHVVGAASLS